jgi:hypothetical protein
MIKNKMTFCTKLEKASRRAATTGVVNNADFNKHKAIHDRDSEAAEAGIVLLDEYKFPHAIYPINPTEMTIEGLKHAYSKIAGFLDVKSQ